jgi:molybdopterin/thiamine biosynthesis adenylyltransferase
MHKQEFSVAISESLNSRLSQFLIRADKQEDLVFALWTPSSGVIRSTALLHTVIYPEEGERLIHGNVSFMPGYFERVCALAAKEGCGIAFMHSHPYPGWQGMSEDDVHAEQKIAGAVAAITGLPLVGMTIGSDGTWSARTWWQAERRRYIGQWCHSVRVVGLSLKVDINDALMPKPEYRDEFRRTVTVWGRQNHEVLARLRIGIVGLGSVGSIVAEILARMGMQRISLIDFDEVQPHNLDRLMGATSDDIGTLKVVVAKRQIEESATASAVDITLSPFSLAEEEGYRAALDCDVIFCCVDRPRARHILNHFAYGHLIPVVDGGIEVRFNEVGEFKGVDWQLQTVAPGRPCLQCLGAYKVSDVDLEASGKFDDPSYMKGLPKDHRYKNNENVFPFSTNLASLEVLQMIALVTGVAGICNFGVQRYRYWPGNLECDVEKICDLECDCLALEGAGDRHFKLFGRDIGAETARARQATKVYRKK